MDEYIKAGANNLRTALYNVESRINQIRGQEQNEKHNLSSEESRVSRDLHESEFNIARTMTNKDKNEDDKKAEAGKLAKQMHDLTKYRDDLKQQTSRHLSDEEREITSLQSQEAALRQIIHTLDTWT
jgi:chromosome segregation ATPase